MDSEHTLKLELMRFVDGLCVREIIHESKVFDLIQLSLTKIKKTDLRADWGNNQKNQYGIADSLK